MTEPIAQDPGQPAPLPVPPVALPQPAPRQWAVVLVHGVGDTKSRAMIDSVADAINSVKPGLVPDDFYMVDVPSPASVAADAATSIWRRHDRAGNGDAVVFAQVFWADLSRIREDWFSRLVGLFSLIFGFRHVARAASLQPGGMPLLLRGLLWLASFVLRGPVLALYLFTVGYALFSLVLFAAGLSPGSAAAPWLLLTFGLVAAAVGLVCWVRNVRYVAAPWVSLLLVGVAAAALAIITWWDPTDGLSGWLRGRLADWFAVRLDQVHDLGDERFHLVAMLWAANWVFAVATGSLTLAAVVWLLAMLAARLSGQGARTAGLTAAYAALALQISFSVLILAPASFIAIFVIGHGTSPVPPQVVRALSADLYMYVGAQSLNAIFMGIAVGGVTWRRVALAGRRSPGPYPRLIVGAPVLIVLLMIQVPFFVLDVLGTFGVYDWVNQVADRVPGAAVVAVIAYVLLLLGFLALPYLPVKDNPLHIVMDIVNHFVIRRQGLLVRRPVQRPDEQTPYAIRNEIDRRFVAVLNLALQAQPTHLLIMSHSQGTIIALEGLQAWPARPAGPQRIYLTTFGCPLTHIYEFYFPDEYPLPKPPGPHPLSTKLDVWRNVFRIDDYVGTEVAPFGAWPDNRTVLKDGELDPGGLGAHTRYWEQNVFEIIQDLLPG